MILLSTQRAARAAARRVGVALAAGVVVLAAVATLPADAVQAAGASSVPSAYASASSTPRVDSYYPAHGNDVVDALHYGLDLTWHTRSHDRWTGPSGWSSVPPRTPGRSPWTSPAVSRSPRPPSTDRS